MSHDQENAPLALLGGIPVRSSEKTWPQWPVFDDGERTALNAVLESGRWWYGEKVAQFERDYAAFQGADYCISCTSGTTAIEVVLQALGIGPGDEVIVPPYTFIATASAVLRQGAIPVFVDIDENWCMDPEKIAAAITPRTKAIMPVHFGGRICDMDRLKDIAVAHDLLIIEDACHAWGGRWVGCGAGTLGLGGVFSFQMSKNLTAGEGGAIVTSDAAFASQCRSIVNCGRGEPGSPWYHHVNLGTNARMTEFQAAILCCQVARAGEQLLTRERNATILNHELEKIDGLIPQPQSNRITRRPYHLYCLRIDENIFGCSREQLVAAAVAEGWPLAAGYPLPLYEQPVFKNWPDGLFSRYSCPVTEDFCYRSALWMTHEKLLASESDMWDIITIARKIKAQSAALRAWTPSV